MWRVAQSIPPGRERAFAKRVEHVRHIVELYPLPPRLDLAAQPPSSELSKPKRQWEREVRDWRYRRMAFHFALDWIDDDVISL